jgi:tripartite-type tricarboxylate transporter receptor subunit TctC
MSVMTRRTFTGLGAGGAALLAAPRIARAAFPERTIRIMVGFGAGGTVDTIARIVAQAIGPILGQSVIVENRPGGSGASPRTPSCRHRPTAIRCCSACSRTPSRRR